MKLLITPAISLAIITFQQFFSTGLSIDSSTVLTTNTNQTLGTSEEHKGGLRSRNLQYGCPANGTKMHISMPYNGWNTHERNTKNTHERNTINEIKVKYQQYGLRFKFVNTKCNTLSVSQDAWATMEFTVYCPVTIKDIRVNGNVNQNSEDTDFLEVYVDNRLVTHYSANGPPEGQPGYVDHWYPPVSTSICSMGKPKQRIAFEPLTLQPGKHSFLVRFSSSNDYANHRDSNAYVLHQGAFYDIKFIVDGTNYY